METFPSVRPREGPLLPDGAVEILPPPRRHAESLSPTLIAESAALLLLQTAKMVSVSHPLLPFPMSSPPLSPPPPSALSLHRGVLLSARYRAPLHLPSCSSFTRGFSQLLTSVSPALVGQGGMGGVPGGRKRKNKPVSVTDRAHLENGRMFSPFVGFHGNEIGLIYCLPGLRRRFPLKNYPKESPSASRFPSGR